MSFRHATRCFSFAASMTIGMTGLTTLIRAELSVNSVTLASGFLLLLETFFKNTRPVIVAECRCTLAEGAEL